MKSGSYQAWTRWHPSNFCLVYLMVCIHLRTRSRESFEPASSMSSNAEEKSPVQPSDNLRYVVTAVGLRLFSRKLVGSRLYLGVYLMLAALVSPALRLLPVCPTCVHYSNALASHYGYEWNHPPMKTQKTSIRGPTLRSIWLEHSNIVNIYSSWIDASHDKHLCAQLLILFSVFV